MSPVLDGLPPIPVPFDHILLGSLLVALAVAAVAPSPRPFLVGALGLALSLAIWDQSRWQPWLYQYLLMLSAFLPGASRAKEGRRPGHLPSWSSWPCISGPACRSSTSRS